MIASKAAAQSVSYEAVDYEAMERSRRSSGLLPVAVAGAQWRRSARDCCASRDEACRSRRQRNTRSLRCAE